MSSPLFDPCNLHLISERLHELLFQACRDCERDDSLVIRLRLCAQHKKLVAGYLHFWAYCEGGYPEGRPPTFILAESERILFEVVDPAELSLEEPVEVIQESVVFD